MTGQEEIEREKTAPEHNHERTDVRPGRLIWFGGGLALLGILTLIGVAGFIDFLEHWDRYGAKNPLLPGRQLPSGPRLPATNEVDWEQLKARDLQILNGYGWIDRQAGRVHIPIDSAMDLVLQRGLKARQSPMQHFPRVTNDAASR